MSRPATLALGIIIALIVGALVWWNLDRSVPEPDTPAGPPAAAAESSPAVEPLPPALPVLDGSDEFIREMLSSLGLLAPLVDGLQGSELVRTFVVAVNRVADGGSPRRQLGFLEPPGSFATVARGERLYIDPASYHRYDAVSAAIAAVDPQAAARAFRQLQPLLEAAQAELGTGETFEAVTLRAVQVLLETPVLGADVEVVDAIDRYRYADAALEGLTPAQQHLLRMGPSNTEAIQGELRRFRDALAALAGDG